jgi:ribosomal protein S18 acetylase RimI-like enzyme
MMDAVEKKVRPLGCPKINLQVRSGNSNALKFYDKIGYKIDEVVSMGKRLVED